MAGVGLAGILQNSAFMHGHELTPARRDVYLPDLYEAPEQFNLSFDIAPAAKQHSEKGVYWGNKKAISSILTHIVAAWNGGYPVQTKVFGRCGESGSRIMPDIMDFDAIAAGEEKSAEENAKGFKIRTRQIRLYEKLLSEWPDAEIYFEFVRYRFKELEKHGYRQDEELLSAICSDTIYAAKLPFEMIVKAQQLAIMNYNSNAPRGKRNGSTRNIVSYYPSRQGDESNSAIYLSTGAIDEIFTDPAPVLKTIGLDPDRFMVQSCRSPSDFRIQGQRMNQIPVVQVTYRDKADYDEWKSKLVAEFKQQRLQELEMQRAAFADTDLSFEEEENVLGNFVVKNGANGYGNGHANGNGYANGHDHNGVQPIIQSHARITGRYDHLGTQIMTQPHELSDSDELLERAAIQGMDSIETPLPAGNADLDDIPF